MNFKKVETLCSVFVILVALICAPIASSCESEDIDQMQGSYASTKDAVSVVVLSVDRHQGTRENPPLTHLRVTRSLKGRLRSGETFNLSWSVDPEAFFWAQRGGTVAYKKWLRDAVIAPKVGSQSLLCLSTEPTTERKLGRTAWTDSEACRLPSNHKNLERVMRWLSTQKG